MNSVLSIVNYTYTFTDIKEVMQDEYDEAKESEEGDLAQKVKKDDTSTEGSGKGKFNNQNISIILLIYIYITSILLLSIHGN